MVHLFLTSLEAKACRSLTTTVRAQECDGRGKNIIPLGLGSRTTNKKTPKKSVP